MSIEENLYKAQSALSCLTHLACYYDNTASVPPKDFGAGLYYILGYIEDDIRAAYNECTKPEGKPE